MSEQPERRRDQRYFRQLLDRTAAQVGLLDAIDQGYQEFVGDVRRILARQWRALGITAVAAVVAIALAGWQFHRASTLASSNRTLIARECRDIEALKTAVRDTLHQFVPRERRSLQRFHRRHCPPRHADP